MKYFIPLFCLLAVLALANSSPVNTEEENENSDEEWVPAGEVTEEEVERFKRVTCDLLGFQSAWFTAGDSFCAAHCLFKRFKGGHCRNGVCECRN